MIFVLALVAAVAVLVGLWRLLGPQRDAADPTLRTRVLAPDDDPDFLRELGERTRRPDDDLPT